MLSLLSFPEHLAHLLSVPLRLSALFVDIFSGAAPVDVLLQLEDLGLKQDRLDFRIFFRFRFDLVQLRKEELVLLKPTSDSKVKRVLTFSHRVLLASICKD